eukprot:snap_masked-scaffold_2-processed-gene-17.5-mRNA-1 protein AED:1.00 eAED:1.00 QI:0/0/0/0/1/1/2/0/74
MFMVYFLFKEDLPTCRFPNSIGMLLQYFKELSLISVAARNAIKGQYIVNKTVLVFKSYVFCLVAKQLQFLDCLV